MEKKADINLVDLAGRSVVFALFSLKCSVVPVFFIPVSRYSFSAIFRKLRLLNTTKFTDNTLNPCQNDAAT